jgi:cell division protein FtsB
MMKWAAAVLLVLLAWLQYRLWFAEGSLRDLAMLEQRLQMMQSQNEALQAENAKLLDEIVSLKTSNELIEERARQDLGLIKQGEVLYLFPDKRVADPVRPIATNQASPDNPEIKDD